LIDKTTRSNYFAPPENISRLRRCIRASFRRGEISDRLSKTLTAMKLEICSTTTMGGTCTGEKRRDWFVKKEMIGYQLVLLLVRHLAKGVVLALQVAGQPVRRSINCKQF